MRFFRRREKTNAASTKNIDQAIVLHLSKSRIPGLKQLKYVGRFLSPLEKFGLYTSLSLAALGLIFLGTLTYRHYVEAIPDKGGHYIEGILGNPQYINPLYSSLNDADADIEKVLFSRLFTKDIHGQIKEDLAERAEVSADNKTYTVYLKEAYWHNGETVSADDVVFTFGLIQNPDYRSPLRLRFSGVSISKTDDRTVVFVLKEPYRDFLRLLDFGILPSSYWQSVSSQTMPLADLNIKPIGSGPYRFKSLVKTKSGTIRSYIVERNESYYGDKPYIDEITFKFYASPEEMIGALNNGELGGLSYFSPELANVIVAKNSLDYHQVALPNLSALFFNLKSKNAISEKSIRQALAAAIDQKSITEASAGRWGIATKSLLPEYVPGNKEVFITDQAKAKSLLEAGGWQFRDNTWYKSDKALSISLTAPENLKTSAEAVSSAWKAIGIQVNLSVQDPDNFEKEVITNKQFDIALYTAVISNGDPYSLWRSTSEANISSWNKTEVDRWLEEARLVKSSNEAASRYQAFLTAAADDVPAIPLFWQALVYPQSKKIKGFDVSSVEDPSERLFDANTWYSKTSRQLKK